MLWLAWAVSAMVAALLLRLLVMLALLMSTERVVETGLVELLGLLLLFMLSSPAPSRREAGGLGVTV